MQKQLWESGWLLLKSDIKEVYKNVKGCPSSKFFVLEDCYLSFRKVLCAPVVMVLLYLSELVNI